MTLRIDPLSFDPPAPGQQRRLEGAAGGGVWGRAGHEITASDRIYLVILRLEEVHMAVNRPLHRWVFYRERLQPQAERHCDHRPASGCDARRTGT